MVEFSGRVVKGRRGTGLGHKIVDNSKWFYTEGKGQIGFKNFFSSYFFQSLLLYLSDHNRRLWKITVYQDRKSFSSLH